jgi:signal transduction histidine kinase
MFTTIKAMKPALLSISIALLSALSLFSQLPTRQIDSLLAKANEISSSNYHIGRVLADSALALSQKHRYFSGEAEAIRIKGLTYFYGVKYSEALTHFLESLILFKKIGDSLGIGKAKNNIAIVYSYQGLYEKSIEIHRENLNMRRKIGDMDGVSTSLNNIAVDLRKLGKADEALLYYKQAIDVSSNSKDYRSLSRYYNNIGNIYIEKHLPDSAILFINKGLELRIKINDRQGIKNSYQSLGSYYSYLGNYTKSRELLERAMQIAKEIGIVYEIESAALELSEVYAKLGNFQKAYENHILYKQMSDSLKSNVATELITRIELEAKFEKERNVQILMQEKAEAEAHLQISKQVQYRNILLLVVFALSIIFFLAYRGFLLKKRSNTLLTKQKEEILIQKEELIVQRNEIVIQQKENELAYANLSAKNSEIETQKQRLQELNATKDKFFSILAHDLISPMNGMMGLSEIMVKHIQQCGNDELKSYILMLRQSMFQTYYLLENLLQWARTQTGKINFEPQPIALEKIIEENIEFNKLKFLEKKININFSRNGDSTVFADANMLNTILRNLISNALKFTPENGAVEIFYTDYKANPYADVNNKNFIKISVKDNGIGINPDNMKKLFRIEGNFTTYGTKNEKGNGLGLILCKEFIEMNDGKIWAESQEFIGTTFHITLPKS